MTQQTCELTKRQRHLLRGLKKRMVYTTEKCTFFVKEIRL
jgi:hypothetical protein